MEELTIFQEIRERFSQKKEIEDEMVFYIFEKMSEHFVESHDDTEWQCYEQFLDKLNKIWQYKQFEGLSSEQSYLYGGIWGGLSMLSYIKKKKTASQKCHTLASKYGEASAYLFLNSVYKTPGVQNKELAKLCNVTPARISQIAGEAVKEGLVSTRTLGKEKRYYIRTMGEGVYNIVQKRREQELVNPKPSDFKMVLFTNEGDDLMKRVRNFCNTLNYQNKNSEIAIAIAWGNKQGENQPVSIVEGRKNILCKQGMSNLYKDSMIFWEQRKGADMIRR